MSKAGDGPRAMRSVPGCRPTVAKRKAQRVPIGPIVGALTVLQPWAWAIVAGHKDVENRGWRFPFPTPATIAIHAGRKRVADPGRWAGPLPDVETLPRSAHVGLVDVGEQHEAESCGGLCSPWSGPEGWHWPLSDPRQLALPVPAYGQLRIWQPAPATRDALLSGPYTEERN